MDIRTSAETNEVPVRPPFCYAGLQSETVRQVRTRDQPMPGPATRLIQMRDASPASAMVLCVFEINWPAESDSERSTACPGFVLTGGWYKMRARTDHALARAARKGKIWVGRKLGIIGARVGCPQSLFLHVDFHVLSQLDSVSKDPDEVLKSFDVPFPATKRTSHPGTLSPVLQRLPFISTLNSLTPDGGLVVMASFEVRNVFSIQYVETLPNGEREMRSEEEQTAERNRLEVCWPDLDHESRGVIDHSGSSKKKERMSITDSRRKCSPRSQGCKSSQIA